MVLRSAPLQVATSSGVRCLMKTGLPRHFTVTVLPLGMFPSSNSADASASTSF
jgi:hypothetical protein